MAISKLTTRAAVTVTTGGTPVALFVAPYPKVSKIYLRGDKDNSGDIYVGDADVLASTERGAFRLDANVECIIEAGPTHGGGAGLLNVEDIFVDATSSGDKVCLSYIEVI